MIEHLLHPSSGRHALNDIRRVLPYLLRAVGAKVRTFGLPRTKEKLTGRP
jgi:hypothetical protein